MLRSETPEEEGAPYFWSDRLSLIAAGSLGVILILILTFSLGSPGKLFTSRTETPPAALTTSPTPSPTQSPSSTPNATPTITPLPSITAVSNSTAEYVHFKPSYGTLILSLHQRGKYQLFAYQPFLDNEAGELSGLPLTQITHGEWDNIHPAVSPDGKQIAFASNREGRWDIYLLDLVSGEITNFSNSAGYTAYPTWSPDGKWLAYEAYREDNLEIIIRGADGESDEINLSNNPADDFSPHWSPQGRKISYITTQKGKKVLYIADLDRIDEEKTFPLMMDDIDNLHHTTWSEQGRFLAWSSQTDQGHSQIYVWDSKNPEVNPKECGLGDWPLWGVGGELLYTTIETPYETYLTAYPGNNTVPQVMLPAVKLPGRAQGLSWAENVSLANIDTSLFEPDSEDLWTWTHGSPEQVGNKDLDMIILSGVQAPSPKLNQLAVDSFVALRKQVIIESGWDFLGELTNAYQSLTTPPEAGIQKNWLYTGRAMEINSLPLMADWMIVVREKYGAHTYWRLFLRARSQDGSQGQPLKEYPWDFYGQQTGSLQAYEAGGHQRNTIPSGYWIDFTELAASYGWKRFPALPNWRSAYPASHWKLFAFTQGLTWEQAMLEIYPPVILITPTPLGDTPPNP